MKSGKILCLFISVILAFSGCSIGIPKENSSTASTSNTPESAVQNTSSDKPSQIQSNTFNNECWRKIKENSSSIGKSFFEVAKEHAMHYEWYGENNQLAYSMDNIIFYFPKLIWNDSICSAVAVEGDNIISDNVKYFNSKDVEAYFGTGYSYHAAANDEKGYFEYDLNNFRVLIYETPEGGIAPSDMYVLIETKDETVGLSELIGKNNIATVISDPQQREASKWGGISEYINKIGKDKSEVLTSEISWEYESDSNYYKDPNSNDGYSFDESGKCIDICVPLKLLMITQNNEKLSMKDIAEYFNLPFVWFIYEDAEYKYSFADIVLFIPSNDNGQVDENTLITISKSAE